MGPSIIHGDFHPGNVFYQPGQPPKLIIIENDQILDSLNSDTMTPTGAASYDFAYCYEWIIVLGQ